MKRVLITGVNSYVGNSFAEWVQQYPQEIQVDKISLREDSWKEMDFSIYDSILHVAGIAHRKETKKNASLYYEVNRDLTIDVADKAKHDGVQHFVFLSSMSVYGLDTGFIDENTPARPKSHYGKSKLEAESYLHNLINDNFKVAILRPPMIYGKDCPGNYQLLRKLTLMSPVFPDIRNKRSMIYIRNLTELIRQIIDNKSSSMYMPQNTKYVSTTVLAKKISKFNKHKVYFTSFFNIILSKCRINKIKKMFGSLYYSRYLSDQGLNYNIYSFDKSVELTEKEN